MTRQCALSAASAAVIVALAAGVATWWWTAHDRSGSAGPSRVPTQTVAVTRTNLSSTTQLSAVLGYAGSYTVTAGATGTITALPQPGQVITQGQPIYEVDGAAVYLFYGPRAAWRALASGAAPGPDVQQLEQNLTTLGYAGPSNLAVDDTFTWATSEALRRWQRATAQPVTGQLALGRVIYEPGPIRVVDVSAATGAPIEPGARILTATSTSPIITASIPPAQTVLVHAGDAVTITLPTGQTAPGRVDAVSTVAVGAPNPSASGSSGGGPVSVPATISLTDPASAGGLDQAPVTVNVTDRTVTDVLAVPVTALVALAGGGYGVWVDADAGRHLVPVTPGLYATSLVQVTASGLNTGDLVEVPAQ